MPEIEEPKPPITLVRVRSKATTYQTMRDALAALVRVIDAPPEQMSMYKVAHAVESPEGSWRARFISDAGFVVYVSEEW